MTTRRRRGRREGYAYQTAVAHGEDAARLTPGSKGGPIVLSPATSIRRTRSAMSRSTPSPTQTTYTNEDGTGAVTTGYAYTWYPGTFQVQEQTTTLPGGLDQAERLRDQRHQQAVVRRPRQTRLVDGRTRARHLPRVRFAHRPPRPDHRGHRRRHGRRPVS